MRRSFLAAISCIALLPGQSGPASAAASFKYVAQAANEITMIDHSTLILSDEQKGRIAKIGCEALTRLVKDPDFNESLKGLLSSKESGKAQAQAYDLLNNVDEFNEEFLRTEEKALQAAGLDFPTTVNALALVSTHRDVETLKDMTVARVVATILQAQSAVCTLKTHVITQEQATDTMWLILGGAIIAANVAATAATVGLAVPAAFTSAASGLGIILGVRELVSK
jgi:hypothetical protein